MSRLGERYRYDWRLRLAIPLATLGVLNTTGVLAGWGDGVGLVVGLVALLVAGVLLWSGLRPDPPEPTGP